MAVEYKRREFRVKWIIVRQTKVSQGRHGQEIRPIRRHKVIEAKVKVPYFLEIGDLRRNGTIEIVVENTDILKLCQTTDLRWKGSIERIVAQVQDKELRQSTNGRGYWTFQTAIDEFKAGEIGKWGEVKLGYGTRNVCIREINLGNCSGCIAGNGSPVAEVVEIGEPPRVERRRSKRQAVLPLDKCFSL
ncbi:hypothetical protein CCACVL1_30839, partial [Corchorus capsularis]